LKVLHLIPYLPTPPDFGGALRIFHLLKHLYENHDLTVAGFNEKGNLTAFEETFPELKGNYFFHERTFSKQYKRLHQLYSVLSKHSNWYLATSSKELEDNLNRIVEQKNYDIIQYEFPALSQYQLNSDAKTILDAHNVEYDNFKRMYEKESSFLRRFFYKREYEKLKVEEVQLAGIQDAVFTTSERDKSIFQGHLPDQNIYVIPNGVDTDFFAAGDESPEEYSLVFTGMMGYVPNYDGINYFIDSVLPLIKKEIPGIKIYVVGKNPPESVLNRASESVIVTGFVDDVRPYVRKSSVFVVPLRMGGGTRLKVLEALSMKKPVVTTSIGCEGIDVKHNEHVLIADEEKEFTDAVIQLLKDRKKAKKLAEAGFELVKTTYEWSAINEKVDLAYQELAGKKIRKKVKKAKLV